MERLNSITDLEKKEAILKVLPHFGGDGKAIDMVIVLYGRAKYPEAFFNEPIEFFKELDEKLLKRNPHRHNMLNPEFVKFEKHRVDFFVGKLRSEMEWGAKFVFSDEVVFEGFTRIYDSKYFDCNYKVNYDEKLGYNLKEMKKHYDKLEGELEEKRKRREHTEKLEAYMREIWYWWYKGVELGCDYVRRKKV